MTTAKTAVDPEVVRKAVAEWVSPEQLAAELEVLCGRQSEPREAGVADCWRMRVWGPLPGDAGRRGTFVMIAYGTGRGPWWYLSLGPDECECYLRGSDHRVVRPPALCVVRVVLSMLRYHWSAVPLALAAIVLLVLGAVLSTPAMVGAGSALAGAAATRIIDLDRERRAGAVQAEATRQRDLDETRRLAYMVLAAQGTEHYELAATVVNALAHHGTGLDPDVAMQHVTAIVNGPTGERAESEAWLRGQIERITAQLNPASPQR